MSGGFFRGRCVDVLIRDADHGRPSPVSHEDRPPIPTAWIGDAIRAIAA